MMKEGKTVEMKGVGKRLGGRWVLAHVDLSLPAGQTVALFGRNGSGKSTLLKIMATLLEPTVGSVRLFGESWDDRAGIRRRLRLLGHEKQLYGSLTVAENLRLAAGLRGLGDADADLKEIIDRMGLAAFADRRVKELSEGLKKRTVLARLQIGKADLILLDEPHPTLDTEGRRILNQLITEWRRAGKTIVLASHDHDQAMAHADRLLVIREGQITYDGVPTDPEKIL